MTPVISNFVRGELSPRMEGRSDAEAFYQGLAELQNALVLPQGGAEKRPGTVWMAETADITAASRLIEFVVDENTRYVLEFFDGGVRVMHNDDGDHLLYTTRYTMTLDAAPTQPWAAGAELTGGTSGVTAYILKQNSSLEYLISAPSGTFTDGEELSAKDADGNTQSANQGAGYPSVATSTVDTIVVEQDSAAFYAQAELSTIKYVQANNQLALVQPNKPPKLLTYYGPTAWTWEDLELAVPSWQSPETVYIRDREGNITGIRRFATTYAPGQIVEYAGTYYRCLNEVYSETEPSSDTTNWVAISTTINPNPFDESGDYPAAVGYFQDRLIFAGTINANNTVWGSATGYYTLFLLGPTDQDAWQYSLLSDRSDKIQWIASKNMLIIGTTGSEWVMGGGEAGITPRSVVADRRTTFGSANIQGMLINENVLFVQKGAKKIREYFYRNELQAYRAADLTFWSDHITDPGIRELAFSSDPDPVLWILRTDGVLLSLTYEKSTETMGWARHVTDGEIESIATIPAGSEDELWMTVKRTIDGSVTRYVEYMSARYPTDLAERHHVDAGTILDGGDSFALEAATAADPVSVTATAHGLSTGDRVRITDVTGMTELEGRTFLITVTDANTFTLDNEDGTGRDPATAGTMEQVYAQVTGLTHLEGETVSIAVDGGPHGDRTVTSGTVTLDDGRYGNVIHVGLPFTMRMQTMNIMAALAEAKRGRMHAVRARFINTMQAQAGYDPDALEEIIFREPSTPYGQPTQLFTGEKLVPLGGDYDNDQRVTIESSLPVPCTVAVILPELGAYRGGQ
jgi:hypothetical protein